MRRILFFSLCFNLFGGLFCVTEDDIRACNGQVFGVVTCTSVSFYRECVVPGAVQVHAIKLHRNFTRAFCEYETSFGFRDNSVWVTGGCSGEFYLCYDGVPMSTNRPVTSRPFGTTTSGDLAVLKGSSAFGDSDVWIYVIVACCVVLLVGVGLIVGCVVKRRQQNDKSRQLAEKRQIRIELKEHKEHMEENGVTMLPPLSTRSLSVESINYGEPVNYSYGSRYEYEKEGSVCSSRSSNSGMTSLSARTTGYLMKTRPNFNNSMRRMHSGIMKKGISTPDISVLGRMYCEANMSSKQHNRSSLRMQNRNSLARGSQSSLESVKEICNKYQVFDIPLERNLKQRQRRPSKYNTVSFGVGESGRACGSRMNYSSENVPRKFSTVGFTRSASVRPRSNLGSMTNLSDSGRKATKAIVHTRSPSVKDLSTGIITRNRNSVRYSSERKQAKLAATTNFRDKEIINVTNVEHQQQQQLQRKQGNTETCKIPRDTQYHDPTSLMIRSKSPELRNNTPNLADPENSIVTISKPESIYETVNKERLKKPPLLPKPKILPKPSTVIYATVNKSYFKAVSKAEGPNGVIGTTFDVMSMEADEDDAISVSKDSQYARLEAFKPTLMSSMPVSTITIPGVSGDDSNI